MSAESSALAAAPAAASPAQRASARLLRNIVLLAGGQSASWAFGLLWLVVVPRRLGPAAIGEFVIAISTTAILGIFVNQGAGPLLTKEIAQDTTRAPQLVGGAIAMRLAVAGPACLGLALYLRLVHFDGEQTLLIWLASALVITASLSGAFESAFSGLERMEYLAYATLVGNGLVSVLCSALVLLGGRIVAVMALDLALTVLVLALNIFWASRLFEIAWGGALRVARRVARDGFSFWIGGLFYTAYLWIASVFLSLLVPAAVVGWYGVPIQIFAALLMVAGVLCTAWFPRMAAAHVLGPGEFQRTARPAIEATVVVSLPIAVGTAMVSQPLITLVAGPRFAGAAPVLAMLAICMVPTFFNMMAYQILQAQGRQVTWFKVVAIATVLNIGANLVLIPHFQAQGNGALGAALSLLATELIEVPVAIGLLPWLLESKLLARVARAGVATALMAACVFAVMRAGFAVEVVTGVMSFTVFGLLLHLPTRDELVILASYGTKLRSRLPQGTASA